ncbi:histone-lysine n-methyltransferase setmar-like protein [Elysia marginata]|uniref:Histone-lysine n-methyltransferase setmar-like protein n=1 Tax=Elysia marginata TaxID=1093978 RepID=A0AAV4IP84_9GAST|nr:histone-lysine n-methyltransferase setmar-like protein [Elysia marginata]
MCAAISVGEKMASARNDHLMKQCSVIEFLTAEGCSAVVIQKRMKAVYHGACLTEGKVQKWARFYQGVDPKETTVRDRKRPGRPVFATDTMHQQTVDKMIVANRRVKQKDIANATDILKERVHHIITVHLGYRKVSARWVPRQLTGENDLYPTVGKIYSRRANVAPATASTAHETEPPDVSLESAVTESELLVSDDDPATARTAPETEPHNVFPQFAVTESELPVCGDSPGDTLPNRHEIIRKRAFRKTVVLQKDDKDDGGDYYYGDFATHVDDEEEDDDKI